MLSFLTTSLTARRCLLLIFPLYALLTLWFGQDANWDLKNYHWYNGYALLTGRFDFDLLPSQTPFFYNPALDAAFYAIASQIPAWLASVLLALLQAANALLLFKITRRLLRSDLSGRDWYAAGAAALAVVGGGTLAELGTVFYDTVVSLGVFASLYLAQRTLLNCGQHKHDKPCIDWSSFVIAGLPVGAATGLKLPTAIFCVGLCGALLLTPGTVRERLSRAFAFGCGVLLGLALTYGFWGAYLWRAYQNPLFPYFNNIFKSPVTVATSARDVNFVPQSWSLRLLFPFAWTLDPKLVGEVPFRDLKLPLLYALLPLLALAKLAYRGTPKDALLTRPGSSYLLWTLGIAYLAWLLMFAIYRYAVPLEMLAAPALLIVIDRIFQKPLHSIFTIMSVPLAIGGAPYDPVQGVKIADKWGTPTWLKPALLAVAALACLASTQVADWGRTTFGDRFVTVQWPALLHDYDPAQTMVVMAGFQPYSHVVPSLPAAMPVIRIMSNFASPGEAKGINDTLAVRIRDWLDAPSHRVLFLAPVYDAPWIGREVLPQFSLTLDPNTCQTVHPNFTEDLSLCPLAQRR